MTLDDERMSWLEAERAEQQHRDQMVEADWLVERDEELALEVMAQERYERALIERPWEFRPGDEPDSRLDRRLFGWRDVDGTPDWGPFDLPAGDAA